MLIHSRATSLMMISMCCDRLTVEWKLLLVRLECFRDFLEGMGVIGLGVSVDC